MSSPTLRVMSPLTVIFAPSSTHVLPGVGSVPSVVYTNFAPLCAVTALSVTLKALSYVPDGVSVHAVSALRER